MNEINLTLQFGKYKGRELSWVIQNDPGYIRWCVRKGIFDEQQILGANSGDSNSIDFDSPDPLDLWGPINFPQAESRSAKGLPDTCFKARLDGGWPVGYWESKQIKHWASYQEIERHETDTHQRVGEGRNNGRGRSTKVSNRKPARQTKAKTKK